MTPRRKQKPSILRSLGTPSVHDTAWLANSSGISICPAKEDGTKRPDGKEWKSLQRERQTYEQLSAWFPPDGTRTGFGAVCGKVSGSLEVLEFDTREAYDAFVKAAREVGLGDVVDQIEGGCCEDTPRGGVHWPYRCDAIEKNQKLAQRPGDDGAKVLIETRGEGGYCIMAPSYGGVHPNGKPYTQRSGGVETITTITKEQRRELFALARTFDEMPVRVPSDLVAGDKNQNGDRPGDRFNRDAIWEDVLQPAGWTLVYQRGDTTYWRRPGKDTGISATTNHAGSDLFYVWSTSTDFEAQRGHNKFSVYAILNHDGDYSAAAKALADQHVEGPTDDDDVDSGIASRKESQATAMVRLAHEAGVKLWHTPTGDGYITIAIGGHHEHHALASRCTRDYLTRLFYLDSGRVPNPTALQAAIATLDGTARFDGDEHDVHVRVAAGDDRVYLDLGDPAWRAVEVTASGWCIVSDPPVRFRRPRGMLPLPTPVVGGSIDELRPFVNVATATDFCLIVTWEIQALRPRGPYPILVELAEQGAAKTTTAKVLRRLCDPSESDVRRPPRNTEDLMIAATNGHIVAFDNLSRLSEDLSDSLSVLATGGGFSVRKLYKNREEEIFQAQRPIILNGISQVATRGDLLDRAVLITLPPITEKARKDEETFWRDFTEARPRILGALLDAVSCGLRRLPEVHLERKPRMADFAKWSVAVEPACPWPRGTFLEAYMGNRQGAVEAILDGDPVADVVRAIAPWSGTATELLAELNKRTPENITRRRDWFSRPRQVSDAVRRLAPGFRKVGIEVEFTKSGHRRSRLIVIELVSASVSSASSGGPGSLVDRADARADARVGSSQGSSADQASVFGAEDAADAADAATPTSSDEAEHAGDELDNYHGA